MSAIDEIARLKADKDVIRSQERNGSYERDIDALEAEIAKLREALTLAENVLSRAPFSTQIWPDGTHPQRGITKIRSALGAALEQSVSK